MSKTTMWRKTTCQACGYSQTTITSYYLDKKQWNANHSLASCRSRQAFDQMMGNPLEALSKMSVVSAKV